MVTHNLHTDDKQTLWEESTDDDMEDSGVTNANNQTQDAGNVSTEPWLIRVRTYLYPTGFAIEAKAQIYLAIPVILTSLALFFMIVVCNIFCGHLTTTDLAGAGLATTMINAFGLGIGNGLCTACDTIFSQVYGSANKKRMGMYLQRCLLVHILAPFVVWIYLINMQPFFLAIGQDPEVAAIASDYLTWFSPGILFHFIFATLSRYMQNQDKVFPSMIIAFFGIGFNLIAHYVLLFVFQFGYRGSAVALSGSYFLICILMILYIIVTKSYVNTWDGLQKESLMDWNEYLKLAIPGMGMVFLELLVWEAGTLLAGFLGTIALGTQTVLYSIDATIFMVAFGLATACNIRTGQSLGKNVPEGAVTAINTSSTLFFIMASFISLSIYVLRRQIIAIFSNDSEIMDKAVDLFPVLIAFVYIDGYNVIFGGALRGCAKQVQGAMLVIIFYYAVCLPMSFILVLLWKLDVLGIWIALLVSSTLLVMGDLIILLRVDFKDEAEKTQNRIGGQGLATVFEDTTIATENTQLLPGYAGNVQNSTSSLSVTGSNLRRRFVGPSLRMYSTSHNQVRRVPFLPYMNSVDVVQLPQPKRVTRSQFRRLVNRRILVTVIILALFGGAVVVRCFMPMIVNKYFPSVPTNHTTTAKPWTNSSTSIAMTTPMTTRFKTSAIPFLSTTIRTTMSTMSTTSAHASSSTTMSTPSTASAHASSSTTMFKSSTQKVTTPQMLP